MTFLAFGAVDRIILDVDDIQYFREVETVDEALDGYNTVAYFKTGNRLFMKMTYNDLLRQLVFIGNKTSGAPVSDAELERILAHHSEGFTVVIDNV